MNRHYDESSKFMPIVFALLCDRPFSRLYVLRVLVLVCFSVFVVSKISHAVKSFVLWVYCGILLIDSLSYLSSFLVLACLLVHDEFLLGLGLFPLCIQVIFSMYVASQYNVIFSATAACGKMRIRPTNVTNFTRWHINTKLR